MESGDMLNGSQRSASEQLERYEQVRGKVQPPVGYSLLLLGGALLTSVYLAAFLALRDSDGTAEVADLTRYLGLLITPVLLFTGINVGARERFSVRTLPNASFRWIIAVATAGALVLALLGFFGLAIPFWVTGVLAPLALFALLAAHPIRHLIAHRPHPAQQSPLEASSNTPRQPLSVPVRWMTVVIGLMFGIMLATSVHVLASAIATMIIMLGIVISLLRMRSAFGLARAGYEWASVHWAAFVFATIVSFTTALCLVYTDWITPAVALTLAVITCGVLCVSVLLPRNRATER